MDKFLKELNEPSARKITIDKSRLLLALKKSLLQATEFVLEEAEGIQKNKQTDQLLTDQVNHVDKRYWIRSRAGRSIGKRSADRLKEIFGDDLDWVGPVYQNPNEKGVWGLFCPLPNILVIKFTTDVKGNETQISQELARYDMNEITEKSKYLGEYHYYVINNIENEKNAYQIKDMLLKDNKFIAKVLFESMPMMVPISMVPNDTNFGHQWNMTRIQAGGAGTTAWDLSTGSSDVVIAILDSGFDLTHPDLQFFSSGMNLGTGVPNGSPVTPPAWTNTAAGHGTACAGIAAATINNAKGVAGVAGSCTIMPLAFTAWTNMEFAIGINYATAYGAKVISLSFSLNLTAETSYDPCYSRISIHVV